MANKRQSAKRATQALKHQARNSTVKSSTKTAVRKAIEAVTKKDAATGAESYMAAIKALSKAASKGTIPKTRASRKISRLTILAKKLLPSALPIKSGTSKAKPAATAAAKK